MNIEFVLGAMVVLAVLFGSLVWRRKVDGGHGGSGNPDDDVKPPRNSDI